MRCLLRIKSPKKGVASHTETTVDAGVITIGRAAGEHLRLAENDLRVALNHAVIGQVGGQYAIQSLAPSGIWHNDALVKGAPLAPGDRVRIGNYLIEVAPPERGHDLVLVVEQQRGAGSKVQGPPEPPSLLERLGWKGSLRALSWTLALATLGLFFLLPLIGMVAPPVAKLERAYLRPVSDSAWNTGTDTRGHQYFAKDCQKCHVTPFVQVKDEACKACHQGIKDHARKAQAKTKQYECDDCHQEHQGTQASTHRNPSLCLDCHAELKQTAADTQILDVGKGFPKDHPNFRISLSRLEDGQEKAVRVSMDQPQELKDESGLFFPHKSHLRDEGIRKPGEDQPVVMGCADCHATEQGGKLMQPISFERHCHSCHKLTYDPKRSDQEVPHGQPEEVLALLRSDYAQRALECRESGASPSGDGESRTRPGGMGNEAEAPSADDGGCAIPRIKASADGRQKPGQTCEGVEHDTSARPPRPAQPDPELPQALRAVCAGGSAQFTPAVLAEADKWIEDSARTTRQNLLFTYRGCAACHDRTEDDSAIVPARLPKSWLPKARFDHSRHEAVECAQCHAAKESATSRDVLIKGIGTCAECHSDQGGGNKTPSTCSSCHGYHVAAAEPEGKAGTGGRPASGEAPKEAAPPAPPE